MTQTRRGMASRAASTGSRSNQRANGRADARRNLYVYDSAARDLEVRRQIEEAPRKQISHETRKNRDKALHMDMGYVFFLMCALCVCAIVLINYIQLQSEITSKVKNISRMESELNTKQMFNDEEYNRIISSIDLEDIKKVAIGELGMTYAKEGQIITYSNAGYDYMRQVSE